MQTGMPIGLNPSLGDNSIPLTPRMFAGVGRLTPPHGVKQNVKRKSCNISRHLEIAFMFAYDFPDAKIKTQPMLSRPQIASKSM